MFTIKVPDEITRYCNNLLKNHNFGNRGVADGRPAEQLTGLIGQCTLQKLFNQPLVTGAHGSDQGEDFRFADKIIDVKTMGRRTDFRTKADLYKIKNASLNQVNSLEELKEEIFYC